MPDLEPTTYGDLLHAPPGSTLHVGLLLFVKDAPDTDRPWRQDGTTKWINSHFLWQRWQTTRQRADNEGE